MSLGPEVGGPVAGRRLCGWAVGRCPEEGFEGEEGRFGSLDSLVVVDSLWVAPGWEEGRSRCPAGEDFQGDVDKVGSLVVVDSLGYDLVPGWEEGGSTCRMIVD